MPTILDQHRPSLMWRWDIGTLSWVVWDGSLTAGALTIGKVDQGAPASAVNRWPIQITDGTDLALVSTAGALVVDGSAVTQPTSVIAANAVVSTANSSTATLGSGNVFTGTSEATDAYGTITVFVFSDVASAANGLSLQFSQDGTNWDFVSTTTLTADKGVALVIAPIGRFFRVVYTNGGTSQATFRLQTKFHSVALSPIVLPLSTVLTDDIPTVVTHSVIGGVTTAGGGGFVDVKVSPSGAVQVGGTLDGITAFPFRTRADTFTSTTNGTTVDVSTAPLSIFGIQVKGTGGVATTWDVRLEGSLNNIDFSTILTHTQVTGDGIVLWIGALRAPLLYFRSRVAGLVLGPATNVVVTILGTV